MPVASADPLDALDPSARRAGPRARIAVGAAVVLFLLAVAVAAFLSAGATGGGDGGVIGATDAASGASPEDASAAPAIGEPALLVHVLGAVAEPGLVEVAAGSRVVDAIAAAGGLAADADPAGVNLARPVVDGEQLIVPVAGQLPAPGAPGAMTPGDGKVHLNTADLAALDTLPRIGPALAQRILDWREANGSFASVDQLREVAGIGDATFSGLVDLVAL
ncbi:ComEA family DNA-binding protein [Agromyces sp. MMS24-JH15]|uniref:ComEA family DNA-binding protein n=1 Tax=Agromyces sp. MMS24-JH15 TaxID=3243765 RepID=UPI003748AEB4